MLLHSLCLGARHVHADRCKWQQPLARRCLSHSSLPTKCLGVMGQRKARPEVPSQIPDHTMFSEHDNCRCLLSLGWYHCFSTFGVICSIAVVTWAPPKSMDQNGIRLRHSNPGRQKVRFFLALREHCLQQEFYLQPNNCNVWRYGNEIFRYSRSKTMNVYIACLWMFPQTREKL